MMNTIKEEAEETKRGFDESKSENAALVDELNSLKAEFYAVEEEKGSSPPEVLSGTTGSEMEHIAHAASGDRTN